MLIRYLIRAQKRERVCVKNVETLLLGEKLETHLLPFVLNPYLH